MALIVIDYLQLMTEANGDKPQRAAFQRHARAEIAGAGVGRSGACLSQPSRKVEDRGDASDASDLRDSGAIEQDADGDPDVPGGVLPRRAEE